MIVLNPSLNINQAWNHFTYKLLVKYKDILTGKVKAQKNTTFHKGITVAQKYISQMQVYNKLQFLNDNNIGTLLGGSNFSDVFECFPLGGDAKLGSS